MPTLEELIEASEKAGEPGSISVGDIIHAGDDDFPAPVAAHSLESAGYTTIYDTATGLSSLTNNNMLLIQLRKIHQDGLKVGKQQYSLKPPADITPRAAGFKCLLHRDSPDRNHYTAMGFPFCTREGIPSHYEVVRHMQFKHKAVWAALQEEEKRGREDADRNFQRAVLNRIAGEDK